jgi:hypothetical protein
VNSLPVRLLIALTISFALPVSAANPEGFRFMQQPGPFDVGLRVVQLFDVSRSFSGASRPLQTLIWYPATGESTARRMRYRDYLDLRATDPALGGQHLQVGIAGWLAAGYDGARDDEMWARRDASAASGRFPVVIYAPSFSSSSWENADLCEYLASHGYIVLASPGMGVQRESTHDLAGVDAQARDISFLVGYAGTLPEADATRIAVVGFSWGGLANVVAAARDSRIDALVALDGSVRYYPGLIAQTTDVRAENFTIPFMYFFGQGSIEGLDWIGKNTPAASGPSVLNGWNHGDLISVRMLGMSHPQFNSGTQRNERFFQYEFSEQQQADYDRQDGVVGYSWVARYTRAFLDDRLKGNTDARRFLEAVPRDNGVPAHTLSVEIRKAEPLAYSLADLKWKVIERGFDHASEVLSEARKSHPDLKVEARDLVSWGYQRLSADRAREAIPLMKIAVQLDPSGSNYFGLAESYERAGDWKRAIESYRQVLERNSGHIIAKQKLEALAP